VRGEIEQLTAERDHLHDPGQLWDADRRLVDAGRGRDHGPGAWDPAAIVDEALAQLVQLGQRS
jgi:hypothetical protein